MSGSNILVEAIDFLLANINLLESLVKAVGLHVLNGLYGAITGFFGWVSEIGLALTNILG